MGWGRVIGDGRLVGVQLVSVSFCICDGKGGLTGFVCRSVGWELSWEDRQDRRGRRRVTDHCPHHDRYFYFYDERRTTTPNDLLCPLENDLLICFALLWERLGQMRRRRTATTGVEG